MNDVYIGIVVGDLSILETVQTIPSDNKNHIYLKFRFSRSWDGLSKTAIFAKSGIATSHVPIEDDVCLIPEGFMTVPGRLSISVFAGDRRTVNAVGIDIIKSGFEDGVPPEPPMPAGVYIQSPDGSVPFIKVDEDKFLYFYNGKWNEGAAGKDGKDGAPGKDGKDGAPGAPGEKGEQGDPADIPENLSVKTLSAADSIKLQGQEITTIIQNAIDEAIGGAIDATYPTV